MKDMKGKCGIINNFQPINLQNTFTMSVKVLKNSAFYVGNVLRIKQTYAFTLDPFITNSFTCDT